MTDKEKIKAEIERLKESGCASPIVICDTLLAFIDSMREESKPKFKVGQTITDPTDSTFTFHINKIEDGRYIEKEDEWVLVKEADANYELVEKPISEDLDEEDSFGWVARDENGSLHLFEVEPSRIMHRWWDRDYHSTTLDKKDFPDLEWEDEPVYVKLPIIVED